MQGSPPACAPPPPPPASSMASMAGRGRGRRRPLACAAGRAVLLAGVVAAAETGCPLVLLPACQLALSLAGLQLSWLCFRVRARLELAFQAATETESGEPEPWEPDAVAPQPTDSPPTALALALADRGAYLGALETVMTPTGFAVKWLADKMPAIRGRDVGLAVALSLLAAIALVALVAVCLPRMVALPSFHTVWWIVAVAGGVGAFAAVLAACLAPTGADAVLLLVLQGCFTFSLMNMVVAQHQKSQDSDPELVDDLYLTLLGCLVMFAWRVMASAGVMSTLFAALLDTLVLVYLLATMMEIADFIDDPYANDHPFYFSTFFLSVSAAQVARWAFDVVTVDAAESGNNGAPSSPRWRSRASTRRLQERCTPLARTLGASAAAAAAAALTAVACFVCIPRCHPVKRGMLVVFPLAALVSQLADAALRMFKDMALVPDRAQLSAWNNGALDVVNPFLLAWVVAHPFSKHLLEAVASSDGSSSSYR